MLAEFFPSLDNPVFSGGVENRCFYIAKHISRVHYVTVFARKKAGEKAYEYRDKLVIFRFGKPVSATSASLVSILDRLIYVFKCLGKTRSLSIDLVEGTNFVSFVPAYLIAKFKRVPAVAFYPDVLIGRWKKLFGQVLGSIGELVEKLVIGLPWTGYIAISEAVKDRLIASGVSPQKVRVIACGIEIGPKNTAKFGNKKLIMISRLVGYKRVDWALLLLKKLESELPDLSLCIIGSGPKAKELKEMALQLKIDAKVTFLQKLSTQELDRELSESILLLHPSLVEGFGIVLVEASAQGLPFVAADIPTSKELLALLRGGEVFKADDFSDFVNKVKNILKNAQKWSRYSAAGVQNSSQFDWKKLSEQTQEMYIKLLKDYVKAK